MMDLFAKLNIRAPAFVDQVAESLEQLEQAAEALKSKEKPSREEVEAILFPKRRDYRERGDNQEEEKTEDA